jgi:uncharacterized membrane protein YhaH (DUF805 family)
MGFTEAISSGFKNYVNFSTRAARSEYWFWTLFVVLVSIVTNILDALIVGTGSGFAPLSTIASLGLLLPGIAVSIRRLHDLDRSGWWLFIVLIPLVGAIILIVWYCTKGTDGPNRFGSDPLGGHP